MEQQNNQNSILLKIVQVLSNDPNKPDEKVTQSVGQLLQAAQSGDKKAKDQLNMLVQIVSAAEKGDQQAVAQIQKIKQQFNGQQSVMAKQGTKLNYITKLNGNCPEGYETIKFKVGGKVCTKCEKKKLENKIKDAKEVKSNSVKEFYASKKEDGGTIISKASNGKKLPKAQKGTEINEAKAQGFFGANGNGGPTKISTKRN